MSNPVYIKNYRETAVKEIVSYMRYMIYCLYFSVTTSYQRKILQLIVVKNQQNEKNNNNKIQAYFEKT